MSTWRVFVRRPDLRREGVIETFDQLELIPRFNDVGTWVLDMNPFDPLARALMSPNFGIEVSRDGEYITGGPVTKLSRKRDAQAVQSGKPRDTLTVSGCDDNVWLRQRLGHPQPGSSAPPYSATEADVRAGVASTVLRAYVDANLGSAATGARRLAVPFSLSADPFIGSTVTGSLRWQNLLTALQELAIAGGGLGFRVIRSGAALDFNVYQPGDRSNEVRLSEALGTLNGYSYEKESPEANYVFVAGQGEGTARTIVERQDPASIVEWGARIETFRDRRDSNDATVLAQEGDQVLADSGAKVTLSISPVDILGQRFAADYYLGDKVAAVIDGEVIREVIRSCRILITQKDVTVTPAIGTPGRAGILGVFDRLRSADRRIRQLERR